MFQNKTYPHGKSQSLSSVNQRFQCAIFTRNDLSLPEGRKQSTNPNQASPGVPSHIFDILTFLISRLRRSLNSTLGLGSKKNRPPSPTDAGEKCVKNLQRFNNPFF
jgi:hypothetical protein